MTEAGPTWESLPQSDRTAAELLRAFVDLVTAARSMHDLTSSSVSDGMHLELAQYEDGGWGTFARLTQAWSYSVRLSPDVLGAGPYLVLSFRQRDEHDASPALPGLELDLSAQKLERAGFRREIRYAEHGRRMGDDFVRDGLSLLVMSMTLPVADGPPPRMITSVTVHGDA